jgi:4a-hydroxytetrahydrobiopterin dehydratase
VEQPRKFTNEELTSSLADLKGWSVMNGKLHKEYKFHDFVEAFGFMTSVALVAEQLNHHPEWCNVYNRLSIDLTTHDLDGISTSDIAFARIVDRLG